MNKGFSGTKGRTFAGSDKSSAWKIVMLIEIFASPQVSFLFWVLVKQLAFKAFQIVHDYFIYC